MPLMDSNGDPYDARIRNDNAGCAVVGIAALATIFPPDMHGAAELLLLAILVVLLTLLAYLVDLIRRIG